LLISGLAASAIEIKDRKYKLDHSSHYPVLSPLYEICGSLKGKLFHATKENIELKQEVAYLTARLKKTKLSEKMIEKDLNRVEKGATKSTYKLGVGFERCEDKGEKSAPMFILSSNCHTEEEVLKPIKTHYPPNPKPSFNPEREVKRESPKPSEEAFVCIFCGCAGHLIEFSFSQKRIEKMHFEYARNSYRDELIDFPSHSYSRASPHTSSCALPYLSHGPDHCSYGFGLRENNFMPRLFGYNPHPHHGDRFLHRHDFPTGESYTTLSLNTWMVHIFPVMVLIPLVQRVRSKRL
jgi:hypothetical protein